MTNTEIAREARTTQSRRSTSRATDNSIPQNAEKVNTLGEKGSVHDLFRLHFGCKKFRKPNFLQEAHRGESEPHRRAFRAAAWSCAKHGAPRQKPVFIALPASFCAATPTGPLAPLRVAKNKKAAQGGFFVFGGSEGNRTPVRKPRGRTFSVGSLCFRFPFGRRSQTPFALR